MTCISRLRASEKQLLNLVANKASDPDQMPNTYLKTTAEHTAGELPSDWLSANVSPIFKKGDKYIASNYRPVSLTCVCCKLLEHCIVKHIRDHLDLHNILTDRQHGFRARHSCETQLIILCLAVFLYFVSIQVTMCVRL